MGGWIALILAGRMPARIAGLVGIAAAPDFTEDAMWAAIRRRAARGGSWPRGGSSCRRTMPSDPYPITRRLIEDGRQNLVLRAPLELPFPVRLLHGTADRDVDLAVALRLLAHASGADIRLTLVKDADHRFSAPGESRAARRTIEEIL